MGLVYARKGRAHARGRNQEVKQEENTLFLIEGMGGHQLHAELGRGY